jgi:hypothetical protein
MTKTFEDLEAKVDKLNKELGKQVELNSILNRRMTELSVAVFGDPDALQNYAAELAKNNFPGPAPIDRGLAHTVSTFKAAIIELVGDREEIARWEKTRAFAVLSGPERPSGGLAQKLLERIDRAEHAVAAARAEVDAHGKDAVALSKRFAFVKDLEAFFGPLMAGKNPPLDGNQVASQGYVDASVARIAGAIREEIRSSLTELRDFVEKAIGGIREEIKQSPNGGVPSRFGRAMRAFMGDDNKGG